MLSFRNMLKTLINMKVTNKLLVQLNEVLPKVSLIATHGRSSVVVGIDYVCECMDYSSKKSLASCTVVMFLSRKLIKAPLTSPSL